MVLAGGLKSNLSGKPTFLSALLNDGWVTTNDPKQTHKEKPPEGVLGVSWWHEAELNQGLEILISPLNLSFFIIVAE